MEFELFNLPDQSKLWIYQSNRVLSEEELTVSRIHLTNFMKEWHAHGIKLSAGFEIIDNQIILLAVNEQHNMASGCSIDKSVGVIKTLGEKLNVDFFDRNLVILKNNELIQAQHLNDLSVLLNKGIIKENFAVLNPLCSDLGEFRKNGWMALSDSWQSKFI